MGPWLGFCRVVCWPCGGEGTIVFLAVCSLLACCTFFLMLLRKDSPDGFPKRSGAHGLAPNRHDVRAQQRTVLEEGKWKTRCHCCRMERRSMRLVSFFFVFSPASERAAPPLCMAISVSAFHSLNAMCGRVERACL